MNNETNDSDLVDIYQDLFPTQGWDKGSTITLEVVQYKYCRTTRRVIETVLQESDHEEKGLKTKTLSNRILQDGEIPAGVKDKIKRLKLDM